MLKNNNNKYVVESDDISYVDVMSHNDEILSNLGYQKKRNYRSDDTVLWNVGFYFLKGGKGKGGKFYNDDSLILDSSKVNDGNINTTLTKRHLIRNDIFNKKYVVIKLNEFSLIGNYNKTLEHHFSDSYYTSSNIFRPDDKYVEDFTFDRLRDVLPKNFRHKHSFLDIVDKQYYLIIPSVDVLYDENFPLVKEVRGIDKDEDDYDVDIPEMFLSKIVDVEVPKSVEVDDFDFRVITQKINSYKNGTNNIEISMSEIYKRFTENWIEPELDSIGKDKLWFGEEFSTRLMGQEDKKNPFGMLNTLSGRTSIHFNPFELFQKEKYEGYKTYEPEFDEESKISDDEKMEKVIDTIDSRRKLSLKGLRKFKRDTKKEIDEVIEYLKESKTQLETTSKEFDNLFKKPFELNYDMSHFKDTWVEERVNSKIDGDDSRWTSYFHKKLVHLVEQYSEGDISLFKSLDIETLKKFRTSGSEVFKKLFEGSSIIDTSKDRNIRKDKIDFGYEGRKKLDNFVTKYYKDFYGYGDKDDLDIPNEDKQFNELKYGSLWVDVYVMEKMTNLVISELENLIGNKRFKKQHSLFKDDLDMIIENYRRDNLFFGEYQYHKSSPVSVIDNPNENISRIKVLEEVFVIHMTYYPKVRLMEIPTEPKPSEDS